MSTIYVHVRHWLFWYGVYGFCGKSNNDEITLFRDKNKNDFLGYFDLSTERCLLEVQNELDQLDEANKEWYDEINQFIQGDQVIDYSYIYPRDVEDLAYQVDHSAPTNEKGHKPVYIYMWSKLSKYWDVSEIEKSVKVLSKNFLDMEVQEIVWLEVPTYEEAKISYEQDYAPYI